MTTRERLLVAALAVVIALAGVPTSLWLFERSQNVRCFEDEVVAWTGERHDRCVPVDELLESR